MTYLFITALAACISTAAFAQEKKEATVKIIINENGKERINTNRTKEALDTGAEIIVANCPFCTTMLEDGVKSYEKQTEVKVLDIVELLNSSI